MQNNLLRWWYLHQNSVFAFLAGVISTFMIHRAMRGEYGPALIDLLFVLWNLRCAGVFRVR